MAPDGSSNEAPTRDLILSACRVGTVSGNSDPLILDLDGTLLRTDSLWECALAYLRANPLGLIAMVRWMLLGRAVLKQELARRILLEPARWPIHAEVEAFARREKALGRQVFLATAADGAVAHAVADHLGFFDGVFASDGRVNLKGERKLAVLRARFPAGFAYAGDSVSDYPIWAQASETILVGNRGRTRRMARRFPNTTRIFDRPPWVLTLIECGRPHQWAKNALVFVPAVLGGALANPGAMLAAALAFAALCIAASATYVLNDFVDVEADRRHWTKCNRPIASGRLPPTVALVAIPLGLAAGAALANFAAPRAALVLLGYLLLTVLYSFWLKRVPVLDVVVLAGLFTARLVLGIVAAGVVASPWLLVFSMFLFTSLCFAKRYTEIERAARRGRVLSASRGYVAGDGPLVFALGLGTGIGSIIIMVLYVIFDAYAQTFYGNTAWLWAFPLIQFVWFARIWLAASRGDLDDDPVAFAVNDRSSMLLGGLMLVAFLMAWSGVFA